MTPLPWLGRAIMLVVRWLVWLTDMDDGSGSKDWTAAAPSATKVLGAACVMTGLWLMLAARRADAIAVGLVALGMSAVFGRSVWKLWLGRNTWTSAATTNVTLSHVDETRRTIAETVKTERNVAEGFDPSVPKPARTTDEQP